VASPLPEAVRREVEAVSSYLLKTLTEVMGPGLAFSCGVMASTSPNIPKSLTLKPGRPHPALRGTGDHHLSTVAFLGPFPGGDRALIQKLRLRPPLVRLGEIAGRTDPILSVGGIKVHPDQIGALLTEALQGHPPKFSYRVVSEEGLEILDIELTVEEVFFSDEIKALECLCRRARRHLADHLGINADHPEGGGARQGPADHISFFQLEIAYKKNKEMKDDSQDFSVWFPPLTAGPPTAEPIKIGLLRLSVG
jgi:phenylacetate-CoA ligase